MVLAITLIVWFALLMFGSLFVERLWCTALGRGFRFFVAPGVIVHEYSHALACLLMGARIEKIALFERTGGFVRHSVPRRPKWPPVVGPSMGMVVISFAPVFGCLAVIALIFVGLGAIAPEAQQAAEETAALSTSAESPTDGEPTSSDGGDSANNAAASDNNAASGNDTRAPRGVNSQPIESEPEDVGGVLGGLGRRTWNLAIGMGNLLLKGGWAAWVGMYLMLSMVICMNPSKKDFENSKIGWVILLVVIIVVSFALSLIPAGHSNLTADVQLVRMMQLPIALTLALLALASAVTLVVAAPIAGIRRGMR